MSQLNKVLIIGGGIGGMSTAIALRKLGIAVDLVELDPEWRVYGAGISISPASIRSFAQLGILPQFLEHGSASDGIEIMDVNNHKVGAMPTPNLVPGVGGNGGIMRPVLKDILSKATLASGTTVKLGTTFTDINQTELGAQVTFSDGSSGLYDLVVGADGLMSKVRAAIFPDAPPPAYTGQGCWRAVFPRPADLNCMRLYVGTPYKLGFNPVSATHMYMYLLENSPTKRWVKDDELHAQLRELMIGCGGVIRDFGLSINAQSLVMFRPLEGHLMPRPWHRGRILLIGDAAHATTPHLASGAGLAIEDALVLADEVARQQPLEATLAAYTERRWERSRLVIQNSLRLGEIEQGKGGTQAEHVQLMRDSMIALMAPI